MLSAVLGVLADRYTTRGYLASGKISWDGLAERLKDEDVGPVVRRLVVMGAVLADQGGVSLTVPLRLEVLHAPVLRYWVNRVEALGREDFQEAAEQLARSELGAVLEWTVHSGAGLDESALQCAAGCAGALIVKDLVTAPMAFTAVVWHPGRAIDKLEWLMRQRPGVYRDAAQLQAELYKYVPNRNGGQGVPLPLGMLRAGTTVPVQARRRHEEAERPTMRVIATKVREPLPHKCGPRCTNPSHFRDV